MPRDDRKRSHSDYVQDTESQDVSGNIGVGAMLADIRATKETGKTETWTIVDRNSKKRKKTSDKHADGNRNAERVQRGEKSNKKDNRPALTFAEPHKLHSMIKIADLQSMVLYCLADGTSPQWMSVRHHGHIVRAVVLLVPGLEMAMFNNQIELEVKENQNLCRDNLYDGDNQDTPGCGKESSRDEEAQETQTKTLHQKPYSSLTRSPDDYLPTPLNADKLPSPLKSLASIFKQLWPVRTPGDDKYYKVHSPLHGMLTAPIPKSQDDKKFEKDMKGPNQLKDNKDWKDVRTPITTFIASKSELQENEFTLHPAYFADEEERSAEATRIQLTKKTEESGWKDTMMKDLAEGTVPCSDIQQGSITAGRIILALDCEMCLIEGGVSALTRISVVGWDGEVVMDELVKPDKPIIDYLTPYSGITEAALRPISTTLTSIQGRLLALLTPQTILVGHSLNADLDALKLTHPFIIDTSIIFQHPRGPPLKSSLKWLTQKYLNREIQKGHGSSGHDSIEDAKACLDLVRKKCEKGIKWATFDSASESIFKRLGRTKPRGASVNRDEKIGAIIDHGHPERNFGTMARVCIGCTDDDEVVAGVKRAVLGDQDGGVVPGGGVDFTWARLRELEALRGWSNDNRISPVSPAEGLGDSAHTGALPEPSTEALSKGVARTVSQIIDIHAMLPPCTLFVVYSGTGDPREMSRLQEMQRRFRAEYKVKKWDSLSVRWTDTEDQALKEACRVARHGLGLIVGTLRFAFSSLIFPNSNIPFTINMFTLRRAAIRVLSTPYSSLPSQARSISILQPSILRAARPSFVSAFQKRFASDDVTEAERKAENDTITPIEGQESLSSEHEEQSAVASANSSAAEAASSTTQAVREVASNAAAAFTSKPIADGPVSDGTVLYVGNLFFDVSEEMLSRDFARFGEVESAKIIFDGRGLSKGFGYITFKDEAAANKAIETMDQQVYEGRRLSVQQSVRKERPHFTGHKNAPTSTLFIGNMSFDMSDQDLNDLFREIKNVIDVRVAIDRRTGQPRGFAHADFVDAPSAKAAMVLLENKEVYGRRLRIDFSLSSNPRKVGGRNENSSSSST